MNKTILGKFFSKIKTSFYKRNVSALFKNGRIGLRVAKQIMMLFLLILALSTFAAETQNIALEQLGNKVSIGTTTKTHDALEGVIDGNVGESGVVHMIGIPAELIISFLEEREVNKVRIYPGTLKNRKNPGGCCQPVSYEVDGYINNGWAPLVKVENATPPTDNADEKSYFWEHEFPSMYLSKLRIRINKSADTGRRLPTSDKVTVPPALRVSMIREIQVFESKPAKYYILNNANYLQGDFRAAYYRNCKQARLDVIVAPEHKVPIPVNVFIMSPDNKKKLRKIAFILQKGMNELILDISELPSGRYPVSLEIKKNNITEGLTRLLRIDNGSVTPTPKGISNVSGKRIYLIDDYYVEKKHNLSVAVNQASTYLATWMKLDPTQNHWKNKVHPLALTDKDQLLLTYQNWDNGKYNIKKKICRDPEKSPGIWEDCFENPVIKQTVTTVEDAAAKWKLKTSLDKAVFRFYDSKRDGIPPLNEIYVLFTGAKRRNFSDLPIPYRSTFPVWEKREGEILFLTKKPIAVDRSLPGGDVLENVTDTNDNFGGQHLSADGKTLYYIVGRVIKRFPPYIVGYDNNRFSNRLLAAFYSQDGFNWKQQLLLPVSEQDPWSLQQYGAKIFKDPEADIYWGFLSSYYCLKQQMYIDIIYSRDLLNWSRPGDKPFIANSGVPDDWRFGLILCGLPRLRLGNNEVIFMNTVLAMAHLYFKDDNTPERIRRRYGIRGLDKMWPYFSAIGGYENLSKSMKLAYTRRPLGIALARPNGYLALQAGDLSGELLTHPLKAQGSLCINAKTSKNGQIFIQLLDMNDSEIAGMKRIFKGDCLNQVLFDKLPEQPFKMKISMCKAELFSIYFTASNSERKI